MSWVDPAILTIVLVGALKGFKSGFISELMGFLAFLCGIWACFAYTGFLDAAIAHLGKIGTGSSHAIGLLLFGAEVYTVVWLAGFVLNRAASSPLLKAANAFLGASIGVGKSLIFVWAILYAILFFPLTRDVRRDLHASALAAAVTQPNPHLDEKLRGTLPDFAKLLTAPLFERHHV
jgi:uncharacterized membrane protein required for colicin V production